MIPEKGAILLKTACEIALRDDRIGSLMRSAIEASERGDIDAAIDSAKSVLASNCRYSDAAVIQGVLLLHEKGRPAAALKVFSQVLAQDPNNALALWYLAVDSMSGGNAPVALALLEAACKTAQQMQALPVAAAELMDRASLGSVAR